MKLIPLFALVAVLAACTTGPINPRRAKPVDDSWTAREAVRKADEERPRGSLEAWERKRPAEFNQPEAQ